MEEEAEKLEKGKKGGMKKASAYHPESELAGAADEIHAKMGVEFTVVRLLSMAFTRLSDLMVVVNPKLPMSRLLKPCPSEPCPGVMKKADAEAGEKTA